MQMAATPHRFDKALRESPDDARSRGSPLLIRDETGSPIRAVAVLNV